MTHVAPSSVVPLFQKQRFLRSLSEDDFRDRIVRPLFQAMGLEHIRDVCGPNELGKDCFFWHTDPLRRSVYAVQTKKGNINMSGKAKENLLQAVTQLKMALETEIYDSASKSRKQPSCVILCASGTINHHAERHIVESIKDSRLEFRDSDWLIPKLDQFIPEIWNGIDVNKLPYLKGLREHLISQSETLDVSGLGLESDIPPPITEETFCQLYLNRWHSKPKRSHGRLEDKLELDEIKVQDVLSRKERLVLITGDAGSGKTTSLNRLAMILVEAALQSTEPSTVPVRLAARDLVTTDESLVIIATERTKSIARHNHPAFDVADLEAGRVVLLIDGLDELGSDEERTSALNKAVTLHEQYPNASIIITSRNYPFVRRLLAEYPLARYSITPIGFNQAEKMVRRLAKCQQLSQTDTQEFLRRLDNIHGLELNPLLVTVFVASSEYSRVTFRLM